MNGLDDVVDFHVTISTCKRLRLCIDRTPKQLGMTEQLSMAQHTEELRTPRNKGLITSLAKKLNKCQWQRKCIV